MTSFIDDHRAVHGIESICTVLQIAPSSYHARLRRGLTQQKPRPVSNAMPGCALKSKKVWDDNWQVYGVRKAWRQLCREGEAVARCTVARFMTGMGLRGAVRGKAVKTTTPDACVPCPRDKVNRQFRAPAPNMLWVSAFTYVSTLQGFAEVAFVIDTFPNPIVGWNVSRSAKTDFVLDAL
jgi:putative transposase